MTQTEEPQSTAPEQKHSEATLVGGVAKHWRRKLDTLQGELTRLEQLSARSIDQEHRMHQTKGAITILRAVLDDLQKIRPVNQSVLNR